MCSLCSTSYRVINPQCGQEYIPTEVWGASRSKAFPVIDFISTTSCLEDYCKVSLLAYATQKLLDGGDNICCIDRVLVVYGREDKLVGLDCGYGPYLVRDVHQQLVFYGLDIPAINSQQQNSFKKKHYFSLTDWIDSSTRGTMDSETFGIEKGHGQKAVDWINACARQEGLKLEARLYGQDLATPKLWNL